MKKEEHIYFIGITTIFIVGSFLLLSLLMNS